MNGSNHTPIDNLFRREAIDFFISEAEGRDVLRVTPLWSWMLLWLFASLVVVTLLFSFFGLVEVNERGRGILCPAQGVRLLLAQDGGTVTEILAPSGTWVKAGQPILRIQSSTVHGAVIEADVALAMRERAFAPVVESQVVLYGQQVAAAKARLTQLTEDIETQKRSVARKKTVLGASQELRRQGIIGTIELQNAEEQYEAALRSQASLEQNLREAKANLANLEAQHRQQVWSQDSEARQARAHREGLDLSLSKTSLVAPVDGLVEGLVARVGDPVSAGNLLAKVIPRDSGLTVIAFLQEKDRAFVKEGDLAHLELTQYPFTEFGTLRARVLRVSSDLASPTELQDSFGPSTVISANDPPCIRVELSLLSDQKGPLAKVKLRPGMLLQARFTLRRQSLITLAIDPLKRWLS